MAAALSSCSSMAGLTDPCSSRCRRRSRFPMNMKTYNWGYLTEPEPHLNGRRMHCPRGKVLGGSSSINGLVYVRGHPLDFERWEEEGATGWGYRNVLPYFRRAESFRGGADAWRGDSGPLATAQGAKRNPLYAAFIEAGREAGYAVSPDLNGERQEGFGPLDMTVRDGVRASTANAYLRPAMKRRNLKVVTHALATRIAFDGRRASASALPARRTRPQGKRAARGDPVRRADQFAAIAQAFRRRAGGRARIVRDRSRRRSGRRRREPARPSRIHRPGRLETAHYPLSPHRPRSAGVDRGPVAPARRGPRRLESFRGRRLHPLARRRPLSGHPVSFPPACRRL